MSEQHSSPKKRAPRKAAAKKAAPKKAVPKGFTPADEDLELPPEQPQQEMPKKNNPTPDLTDEQYLEQLFLIAQAIAVMPGQRDNMPNVTTPPPIRPRWAAFMLSLGLRIHPPLATHRLRNDNGPAAGNWGPRERVELGKVRSTMKRADMFEVWQQINPEQYAKVQSGELTRDDLLAQMPNDMQQAVALLNNLRQQEAEQQRAAAAAAKAEGG